MFALLLSFLSGCGFSFYVYTQRQKIYELDQQLQSVALSYIFKMNSQILSMKQQAKHIYDEYVVIKLIVDVIHNCNEFLKSSDAIEKWVEPTDKCWISRYSIYKNGDRFELQDIYYKSSECQVQDSMNLLFYEPYFQVIDDMNRHQLKDSVILMKNNDKYTIRIYENPEKFLQLQNTESSETPTETEPVKEPSEIKNDFVEVRDSESKEKSETETNEEDAEKEGVDSESESEDDASEHAEYKMHKKRLLEESNNFLLLNDKQSRINFISVEYQGNNKFVDIKIPDSHYICGNQILSPAYIARYLAMYHHPMAYTDNYLIKIIDNNVNIIELGSNQYIEIQEKSYLIKDLAM